MISQTQINLSPYKIIDLSAYYDKIEDNTAW